MADRYVARQVSVLLTKENEKKSCAIRTALRILRDMITLTAPSYGGYEKDFGTVREARYAAARILGCMVEEMVQVTSGDGDVTYCYASQVDADEDEDGAYAVQYRSRVNL